MTDQPWVLLPLSRDEAAAASIGLVWLIHDETSSEWEVRAASSAAQRLQRLRDEAEERA